MMDIKKNYFYADYEIIIYNVTKCTQYKLNKCFAMTF